MLDFLVDENLPLSAVDALQDLGHRARHVREIDMQGARDVALFSWAQDEGWVIVTRDLGFGNLLDYPCRPASAHDFHRWTGQRCPESFRRRCKA
jgi:predicted nuclease of predicted toxin-antitoxin system